MHSMLNSILGRSNVCMAVNALKSIHNHSFVKFLIFETLEPNHANSSQVLVFEVLNFIQSYDYKLILAHVLVRTQSRRLNIHSTHCGLALY